MIIQPCLPRSANRRRMLLHIGAWAAAWGVAGCSAPLPPLRVGSIVFTGYELMFLARETDALDERLVRLVEMPASTNTLRALAAGQLEAANLTLDEFISARADGMDLRVLAVLDISAGADVVFSRQPMGLNDLAGKRVAVEDGAVGAIVLAALLDAARLQPHQIVKVNTQQANTVRDFTSGRADVFVTAEPWASRIEAMGGHRLFDSTRMPGRIVDVLVAHAHAIDAHLPALRHVVDAHFAGLRLLREHPQEASRLMSTRLELPPAQVVGAFRGLDLPDRAANLDLLKDGGHIDQTVRVLQQDMLRTGLMRSARPLSEISDTRALRSQGVLS